MQHSLKELLDSNFARLVECWPSRWRMRDLRKPNIAWMPSEKWVLSDQLWLKDSISGWGIFRHPRHFRSSQWAANVITNITNAKLLVSKMNPKSFETRCVCSRYSLFGRLCWCFLVWVFLDEFSHLYKKVCLSVRPPFPRVGFLRNWMFGLN